MRLLWILLAGAAPVFAQPFSFGVKGGVPLTDFVTAASNGQIDFTSSTNRYIVGPTIELHLPFGLGVEFDALYRRLHYNGSALAWTHFPAAKPRETGGSSPCSQSIVSPARWSARLWTWALRGTH